MICNYQNINDYCCNRYTYFYNDVVSSNGIVTVDDSELASVLRVDNVTGETKVLSPNSTDQIPTCEANDDNEGTNDWECYIISRYVCQNSVGDPPFGIFQEKQKEIIKETYNAALQDGIVVAINNKNVLLPGSIQDQILYKSILSYAQALYDDDTDSTMPSFTDVNGTIYNLGYTDLVAVFKTYFTKAIYYKNLQDTLLTQAEQASTMSDLEQCTWCGTKPLVGTLQPTKYSSQTAISQISVATCEDISFTPDTTPLCDSVLSINFDNLGNTVTDPIYDIDIAWSIAAVGNYLGVIFCPTGPTSYITKINNFQGTVKAGKAICDGYTLTAADGRKYLTIGIGAHWLPFELFGNSISVSVVFGGVTSSITAPIGADGYKCATTVFGWIYAYDDKTFEFVPGDGDQLEFA